VPSKVGIGKTAVANHPPAGEAIEVNDPVHVVVPNGDAAGDAIVVVTEAVVLNVQSVPNVGPSAALKPSVLPRRHAPSGQLHALRDQNTAGTVMKRPARNPDGARSDLYGKSVLLLVAKTKDEDVAARNAHSRNDPLHAMSPRLPRKRTIRLAKGCGKRRLRRLPASMILPKVLRKSRRPSANAVLGVGGEAEDAVGVKKEPNVKRSAVTTMRRHLKRQVSSKPKMQRTMDSAQVSTLRLRDGEQNRNGRVAKNEHAPPAANALSKTTVEVASRLVSEVASEANALVAVRRIVQPAANASHVVGPAVARNLAATRRQWCRLITAMFPPGRKPSPTSTCRDALAAEVVVEADDPVEAAVPAAETAAEAEEVAAAVAGDLAE
jgi:hypothetical protein